jgi:hypothetical protein
MIIFAEPFDAMGFRRVHDVVQLLFFALTFIVYLISGGPIATALAISDSFPTQRDTCLIS